MAMQKQRLDKSLVTRGLTSTRSQAESYIKLGVVSVKGQIVTKPGYLVDNGDIVELKTTEQYVSRAGLKLASVATELGLVFTNKRVLDIGSSTGGFTDFALQHGAKLVVDVDVGTEQLHPSLRQNEYVELHEKTDIRDFRSTVSFDIVLADVSFISLREILPTIYKLSSPQTRIVVMVKPQFEAQHSSVKHRGVIKNDTIRRSILKDFENWASYQFKIINKVDSKVSGAKGNLERFYLLCIVPRKVA